MMPDQSANAAVAPARKRRPALKIALAAFVLLLVAAAGLIGFAVSERGLPLIVARIVAQSGGRITVEEPTGSIAGEMRFRRIRWRSDDATVIADDVIVKWNPGALWRRRLSISGLGARHVDIELAPSTGPASPPADLALPIAIDIERLAVAELEWKSGPRGGRVTGLAFGYAGDAQSHRIRDLALVADFGRLSGQLEVAAKAPLSLAGNATLEGDGPLAGASGTATLAGTADRIEIAGSGKLHDAALSLQAIATPFAEAPFATVIAELTGVDAATFDAALPHTRARVRLDAHPMGAGIAGTADAVNEDAGPLDTERVPIARLTSRFALDGDTLVLDALELTVPEGGGATGSGRIALAGTLSARFALDVKALDLARLHTGLVTTRLSGRIAGDASAARQTLEGDVRDRDLGLAFRAVIDGERVDVPSFRATTAGGSLSGSAQMSLDAANTFTVDATMRRADPSRFAAVPKATLDGTIKARGVLRPQWRADAAIVVAKGSSVEGLAASGTFEGRIAPGSVRDAKLAAMLGSATLRASGDVGRAGDRVKLALDVPRIDELAPLLPASVPQPASGALEADGHLTMADGIPGGEIRFMGRSLHFGPHAAATLRGHASLAPPDPGARKPLAERALALDVTATQARIAERALDTVHATAQGTLARHHVTLALRTGDVDATLAADGALTNVENQAVAEWNATLTAFENRGPVAIRLRAPAKVALRAGYARVADADIDLARGRARIAEFAWDHGRVTTRGSISGVDVANAAKLAGLTLPADTTLVAGGEWSIAAAPRLNGSFEIHRERGDILVDLSSDGTTQRRGLGVTALTINGTFADDALDAKATFAAERAGTASASLAIGAGSGASSGKIEKSAPLTLAAHAELASLAVFQPWFGTNAALGGRAQVDVAAAGTVGDPVWSGSVSGEALRIDAPQYGVNATNGQLRAHLAPDGIVIDTARFEGGTGVFTAEGVIALPGARTSAPTRVTWKAEKFRATNRPDLRLVIDGDGTLALENKRLALDGKVTIVEGHIEYESTPSGELAADIVIKGRTPLSRRETGARDLPLALELDVDLGRSLTFAGEGLETGLGGRVRITTAPAGTLIGRGTIRAVNGTYFAFGQKLTIDRGRLIFDGPLDNPALDIVALRKNLAVEAGVELTGTVKVPRVRVTSSPPVPENEALAWLVTGQGLDSASRVDYAALSAASAALLGKRGKPFTAELAQRIGLDDISLQSSGTASGDDGLSSQVVVFGKRISDRLSLGYEQGLSLASSAIRLEYALSRRVTLRAEAGAVSGVGIAYRRSFQ
jgi:translocation and assembly module TamB